MSEVEEVLTPTYEYSILEVPDRDQTNVVAELNAAGADGWRVVTVLRAGGFYTILLERET